MLIVAPLDANTLCKFAVGLSDNCLTCVFRPWDFAKPIVLAAGDEYFYVGKPGHSKAPGPVARGPRRQNGQGRVDPGRRTGRVCAGHPPAMVLIPPQAKLLACGDVGVGAMAEVTEIAEVVRVHSGEAG